MSQIMGTMQSRVPRSVVCGLAMIVFAWAMINSGRTAVSRVFIKYGTTVLNTAPADAAAAVNSSVEMTPNDAEVHYTRSAVATFTRDSALALREIEQAVRLRPRDYYLWLELGLARDEAGDQAGALTAFNESNRLSPYYAQPRWLRGNLLFRMQRYDEAFKDLREATDSNPEYLPAFIDLAFRASRKDTSMTEQLVQPRTDKAQTEMASYFAHNGKPDEAVTHFKSIRTVNLEARQKLVRDLIAGGALRQAFTVWSDNNQSNDVTVYDGGFEGTLSLDESGFGWRVVKGQPGLSISLDTGQPQSGARSLRISFTGNTNPALELATQLILVQPGQRYKLNFSARTDNLVTGGPVILVAKDQRSSQVLARSAQLPADMKTWQPFSTEFAVGADVSAIRLVVQREECSSSPCPVFGSVNLDSFSLEQVKTTSPVDISRSVGRK